MQAEDKLYCMCSVEPLQYTEGLPTSQQLYLLNMNDNGHDAAILDRELNSSCLSAIQHRNLSEE